MKLLQPVTFQPLLNLRTLTRIRWVAIFGQLLTVLIVHWGFHFPLPLYWIGAMILAAIALNVLCSLWGSHVLTLQKEWHYTAFLGFDILQLCSLLFLTGGTLNPFCLLVLAPISVSAMILSRSHLLGLAAVCIVLVTIISLWHFPLPWYGPPPEIPWLLKFGWSMALIFSIVFVAGYSRKVAYETRRLNNALAATHLALEQEQQISRVGALTAAVVHELGTPLSTLSLVAKEMLNSLPLTSPLHDDVNILTTETKKCQKILQEIAQGRIELASNPKCPMTVRAYLASLIEGLGPSASRLMRFHSPPPAREEPALHPCAELQHGLKNLLQNALGFAFTSVDVHLEWDEHHVGITIRDDGPGFPETVLKNFGEPFLSARSAEDSSSHLGLGLFIAVTLLERLGASLHVSNQEGAACFVHWPRTAPLFRMEEEPPHGLHTSTERL